MFSLAISSIRSRWRPSSRPMIAATSGSASSRLSCQKRRSGSASRAGLVSEVMESGILRDFRQLLDAAGMPIAGEGGGKEGFDTGLGHVDTDKSGPHRDHVGIVVLTREAGGNWLRHQGAASRRHAVDRDRNADPAAAQ